MSLNLQKEWGRILRRNRVRIWGKEAEFSGFGENPFSLLTLMDLGSCHISCVLYAPDITCSAQCLSRPSAFSLRVSQDRPPSPTGSRGSSAPTQQPSGCSPLKGFIPPCRSHQSLPKDTRTRDCTSASPSSPLSVSRSCVCSCGVGWGGWRECLTTDLGWLIVQIVFLGFLNIYLNF